MTTFYLIRHGDTDYVGRALAGRLPGVGLNAIGRLQAERLGAAPELRDVEKVFCSPLDRARETATPLARQLGLDIQVFPEITEVDFGDWTGKEIEALEAEPGWKVWNTFRAGAAIPRGETMLQVQVRVVAKLSEWAREFPDTKIAVFSHGDPIRSALMYYLAMPFDSVHRLQVSTGSISELELGPDWATVTGINHRPA